MMSEMDRLDSGSTGTAELPDTPSEPPSSVPTRASRTPTLVAHAAGLWLLLLVLMPVIGIDRGYVSPDEPYLQMLVDAIRDEGSWSRPYPLADLDPEGRFAPFGSSRHAVGELTPYRARPAFVVLTASLVGLAGVWGPVTLGTLGVAVAALFTALTTRLIEPRAALPALWLCGVGTPLLFHGYVLQGHSLAAAAVAGAMFLVARSSKARRPIIPPAVIVALMIALASLIRRETVYVAGGVLLWSLWRALRGGAHRDLALGAGALVGATVGTVVERLLLSAVYGSLAAPNVPALRGSSIVLTRLLGTRESLFLPSHDAQTTLDVAALVGLVLVLVGAVALRKRREVATLVTGLMIISGTALLRLATSTDEVAMVPGLFMASPALVAGILLVPSAMARQWTTRLLAVTAAVIALAVMATQYRTGWNWGGRFFSNLLPPVAALSAVGWTHAVGRLALRPARIVVGTVCGSVVLLGIVAMGVQHDNRHTASEVIDTIVAHVEDDTIIATTQGWLPRFDSAQFNEDRYAWARASNQELPDLLELVDQRSDTDTVLVVIGQGRDLPAFPGKRNWSAAGPTELPTIRARTDLWVLMR